MARDSSNKALIFDPQERVDFVKGFSKRKQERRELAKKKALEREREVRKLLKKKRKEAKEKIRQISVEVEKAGDEGPVRQDEIE